MDIRELYRWYRGNVFRLKELFGEDKVDLSPHFSWIRILDYPLPPNFLQRSSALLLVLPGLKGSIYSKPDSYYVDEGLKNIKGEELTHIFEGEGYNRLSGRRYARYSLHLRYWNPAPDITSGDNLRDLVEVIYVSLEMLADGKEIR